MKCKYDVELNSWQDCVMFLHDLYMEGKLFHPDDDPSQIIDRDHKQLFTRVECRHLRLRMDEVFTYIDDPYGVCLDIMNEP